MLLGKEMDEKGPGWGAFGGGPEAGETTPGQTAVREAIEESHGILSRRALEKSLEDSAALLRTSKAVVFGVIVPFDLDVRMNAIFDTQRELKPFEGCYEKLHAAWMPLKALYSLKKRRGALAVGGKRLRAPMPILVADPSVQETLQRLVHAYDEADWDEKTLQDGVDRMDKECQFRNAAPAHSVHRSNVTNFWRQSWQKV